MGPDELYAHFEKLAEQMGIVLIEGEGDFVGGYCTANGEQFIVLNKRRPLGQRLRVLGESFRQLRIEDHYIVPALRDFINSGGGVLERNAHG
ncbi:MAG: hypothetical protein V3U24_02495 [Candidatus Neomarinimicrobiota bacterium]